MRKRIIIALMALFMVFSLCPATASAGNAYSVYVGGTKVSTGSTTYWISNGSGGITSVGADASNYIVKYESPASNLPKLTLSGVNITGAYSPSSSKYGIYADGDLNIYLADGTTNSVTGAANSGNNSYGIYVEGSLGIFGSGSLNTSGGVAGTSCGVYATPGILIGDTVIVNATGKQANESYGMQATGYIMINGGTVTAKSISTTVTAQAMKTPSFSNSNDHVITASRNADGSSPETYSYSNINSYKYLYLKTDPNANAVNTAKTIVESGSYTMTHTTANTEAGVKAVLAGQINALSGISATGINTATAADISFSTFTPAVPGTSDNMAGTNGSFTFQVTLKKGEVSLTTQDRTGTITTTAYPAVAKIGSTGYLTLQEAVNAVSTGQTIQLLGNITITDSSSIIISGTKSFTLNLSGKTLDGGSGTSSLLSHTGSGTLTITDSATNGKITSSRLNGSGIGTITLSSSGNLVIARGTVDNTNSTVDSNNNTLGITLDNTSSGTITVQGGTVSSVGIAIYNMYAGGVNVSGGTVLSTNNRAIYNGQRGKITISNAALVTSANSSIGTIELKGGTASDNVLEITGGTVQNTAAGCAIINNGIGSMSVSGTGVVRAVTNIAIYNLSTGKITIGGSATVTSAYNLLGTIVLIGGTNTDTILEITGGTIQNTDASGKAICNIGTSNIKILSGTPVIRGGGNAMSNAPDLSSYNKVQVTASASYNGSSPVTTYNPDNILNYKYLAFAVRTTVNSLVLTDKLTAPSIGGTPAATIIGDAQYTGTVTWNGNPSKFLGGTTYTATVTLTAKSGYTFIDVANNVFTYTGAASVTNAVGSGNTMTVTIEFPATAAKTLQSIVITSPPTKTQYKYGESFSKVGMVVKATYNDGTEDPNFTTYTVDKTGALTLSDTTVTLTANGTSVSTTQNITVTKADGPAVTEVFTVDCTNTHNNDGKLTGVTSAMEYKKSGASNYTPGTGNDITGLTNDTYYVRVKETATHNAGADKAYTVAAYVPAALTGTVTINGTLKYNQSLTATYTLGNNTGILSYQWKRGSTNIGTNSNTYTLVEADINQTLICVVTSTEQNGSVTSSITTTIAKADGPAVTDVSAVSAVGCTNTHNNDGMLKSVTGAIEYKKNGASNYTPGTGSIITGLTNGTYYVRVKETTTHNAGAESTFTVAAYVPAALTGTVTINGTLKYGEMLTATYTPGNSTGTLSYQWKRGSTNIGTNSNKYTLVEADINQTLTCVVTSTEQTGSVTSGITSAIIKADGPAVAGVSAVDCTNTGNNTGKLTGVTGAMQYKKDGSYTNGNNDGSDITGLTNGTYYVRVKETNTHNAGAESTFTVAAYVPAALTGTVTINGTLKYGEMLTATYTPGNNTGTLSYQWKRGSTNIGTNSNTYTLVEADINQTLTCVVTSTEQTGSVTSGITYAIIKADGPAVSGVSAVDCTNTGNNTGKLTGVTGAMQYKKDGSYTNGNNDGSDITGLTNGTYYVRVKETNTHNAGAESTFTVAAYVPAALTGTVTINGTLKYGEMLTATYTPGNSTGTLSYQWKRGSANIGTNSNKYTLVEADINQTLTCVITSSEQNGSVTSGITSAIIKADGPAVTEVSAVGCTNTHNNDGMLKSVTGAMEYKKDDATSYIDNDGSDITGLTNGTYYVRVKETTTHNAGEKSTFTVAAYIPAPTYGISLSVSDTYTVSGAAIGYGDQTPLTVIVSNTGNQETGNLTVALSGTNSDSFTLSSASLSSIAFSGSDMFTVKPNTGLTEGTYTAIVTVSGGNSITPSFTISFTVTTAPITDEQRVSAAKTAVEGGSYTMTQSTANTETTVKDELERQINTILGINNTGITVTGSAITLSSITAASEGTSGNQTGTNGSLTFSVVLTKGAVVATSASITGTITATAYTGLSDTQAVDAAKTAIVNGTVIVSFGADQAAKIAAVQTYVLSLITGNATGVTAIVTHSSGNTYNVTLNKGMVNDSKSITMTIIENTNPDIARVNTAKAAIEGGNYILPRNMFNTEITVKAELARQINNLSGLSSIGMTVTASDISLTAFTAAIAGTSGNPTGTNGSFTFTIVLTKGEVSSTTVSITGVITATAYTGGTNGGDGNNIPTPTPAPTQSSAPKAEGAVEKTQQKNDGAPAVILNNSVDELKAMVLTPEEQQLVAKGENAKVILKVTDISTSVSKEEKKLINEKLVSENPVADTSILYIDLSLYKQVGSQEQTKVTATNNKILITLEVPERFWNTDLTKNRDFYVIRIHDGEVTRIDGSYDPVTHQFTFETDRFSTYALTYQDDSRIQTYDDFCHLQLTAQADKTSQTLSFKRYATIDGYLIYGGKCGEKMTELAKVPAKTTSYTIKNLQQGTYYQYQVKAYRIIDGEQVILMTSKIIHSITESKTNANPTKVTSDTTSVKLTAGKSKAVTCQVVLPKGKKLEEHTAVIQYEVSDKTIATVNKKGKITAIAKGTCYVYAYGQNGMYKKIKVTVE